MNFIQRIALLVFLNFNFIIIAQHPVYTQLTEKDGLPDIEFYDIVEDQQGFIWLAADKGLFRYDGKEFKNYSHPDKRGLSVFGVKLDHKGRVWCNNISGQFFYIENNKMKLFADLKDYARGQLGSYFFFKDYLVFSYFRSTFLCDLETKELRRINGLDFYNSTYKRNDTLFHFNNRYIHYSLNGDTIDGVKNLKKIDKDTGFSYLSFLFKDQQFHYSYDYNVVKKEKGFLKLEKEKELIKVELPKILQSVPIIKFYEFNNDLWICTKKGIFICEYINNHIQIKEEYFGREEVTAVIVDRNDNLWITTIRNGVYIIPNIYLKEYDLSEYATRNVSAMCKIRETELLVATTEGDLVLFNMKTGSKREVEIKRKEKIFAVVEVSENKALVSFGTYAIFLDTKKLTYSTPANANSNVKDFSIKKPNEIVKAAFAYASIISSKSGKELKRIGFKRSYTTHYSDLNKNVYVGYVDGVRMYDENLKESEVLNGVRNIFAVDIDETADGTVWLSTFKDGIIGLQEDKVIKKYTTKNGLLSNLTREIKGDGKNLWISTNSGIQILNTDTGKLKSLTRRDGINSFNITDIIPLEDKLIFSSNKGVFEVDKEKVFKEDNILNFCFTEILVNDVSQEIKTKYELKYNENKVQFNFQINGFLSEDNVQYSYKLSNEKEQDKWNVLGKNINQITFNNLAAGSYEFVLKATAKNNPNQEVIKKINLLIALPFYKEWWFLLAILFTSIGLIWYQFNKRIRNIRKNQQIALEKERLQKELVSTKLETLRSQMNPHFTFNALNSIQNLILKNDKHEAYNYLTKFSSLIRENLHLSTKNFVVFEQELSLINRYLELEKLRFKENFAYKVHVGENVEDVKIPTMIIQPYVENAIKHGLLHKKEGEKKIEIEFYLEEGVLVSKIIDNGIGIEKSREIQKANEVKKKSFSTKSIQERLSFLRDYYKTDIGVEYPKVTSGTTVIIKIPYFL